MKIVLIAIGEYAANNGLQILFNILKKDYDVKIIFLADTICQERIGSHDAVTFENKLKNWDIIIELSRGVDLIGISLSTCYFEDAVEITKKIKEKLSVPIIWGGIHPTIRPKECLEYADIVCRGEGEEALLELVKKIENGKSYSNVKNLCFKDKKGNIILNPLRPVIQNLDSISIQDFSLENQYFITKGKIYGLYDKIMLQNYNRKKFYWHNENLIYWISATRGCVMGCSYCVNSTLNKLYCDQKLFRKRSIDNIIFELKKVKKSLIFSTIQFFDDDFLKLDENYIEEFAKKYKKHVNLPFSLSGVHPTRVNYKKLALLTEAGLGSIEMGIQSGNERIKKMYKRYYSNDQVEKACKIINEFKGKILIHYDILLDNPWETEEELIETFIFLNKLPPPHYFSYFSLAFFPGTEIYELAKNDKIIKDEIKEIYRKNILTKKQNYINGLFNLLRAYHFFNMKINPLFIKILTNIYLRKIMISHFLFFLLKTMPLIRYYLLRIIVFFPFSKKSFYYIRGSKIDRDRGLTF